MGIPNCKCCRYEFTWKEVQKAIRWTYKPLICKKCGTKHVVTKKTQNFFGIPLIILCGAVGVSNIPVIIGASLLTIIIILAILLFPYIAKYKIKEENH